MISIFAIFFTSTPSDAIANKTSRARFQLPEKYVDIPKNMINGNKKISLTRIRLSKIIIVANIIAQITRIYRYIGYMNKLSLLRKFVSVKAFEMAYITKHR